MADEILERIEKQMEGSNLALAAVADVLAKMDNRLSKAEQDEYQAEEQSVADIEKSELIKSIATEVYGLIKADAGLDVDGTKVRSGSKVAQGGSADDSAKTIDATRGIGDQQAVIQAMHKAHEDDEEEYPDEEEEEEKSMEKAKDNDDDDDEKESKGGYGMKSYEELTKQLGELKGQLASYEENIQKQVQTESENRLRKMGFREETSLTAPKQIHYDLGTDGTTPIVKANTEGDTIDQLVNMSYKDLREIQTRIQAGETEGIPRELLG